MVGKDDQLGTCKLDLQSLVPFERHFQWYPLQGVKHGEVLILTLFINLVTSDSRKRDCFGFVINSPQPPLEAPTAAEIQGVDFRTVPGEKLPKAGIPFSHKAEIWMIRSGAKGKRKTHPDAYKMLNSQFDKANEEIVEQIDKDLERTFPDHPVYMPGAPGLAVMRRILVAFSIHTPNIGYCQGMGFLAGFLLLFMDEEDAFWVLECIVNDILPNYYDRYLGGLQVDNKLLDYYIMQYFPDLKLHLEKIHASPGINCMKWFLGIFLGIFPTPVTIRIWDTLFCSGRDVLIKVYLVIVRMKFALGLKVQIATDFYELLNETPCLITSPSQLFADIYKHFNTLFQVGKMRANAQKAISDSINKRDELRLKGQTHFSIKELEDLKQQFSKYAKNNTLTKAKFTELLVAKVGADDIYFIEEMFKMFDKSGDGTVDFREFCTGLSAFTKGTFDERLSFCYSLFDVNGDGYVQPDELLMILGAQYKLLFPNEDLSFVKNFVEFATTTFDANKDGKFSLEEFKDVIHKQPLLVQFLNLTKFCDATVAYSFKE